MRRPVFCLMGPTASGKSDIAYELEKCVQMEVISVDSAMIYRGMNLGTAKPSPDILARIPHHLIDILDPTERYSVSLFCETVEGLVEEIQERGKMPLLVGGTMMYFHALQHGLSPLPPTDVNIRAALSQLAETKGFHVLHQMLAEVDPISASKIHQKDGQRLLRALEVAQLTKRSLSDVLASPRALSKHHWVHLALLPPDRAWLHRRIAERFETMLVSGLVDEVSALLNTWPLTAEHPAMKSVGYRQAMQYLMGDYAHETLKAKGIAATRQLAKRQLTWLRSWPNLHVFSAESPTCAEEIMRIIRQIEEQHHEH